MSAPATPDRTTPDDPPAPSAPLSQAAARTGETLLADLRTEIARADSKASVLVVRETRPMTSRLHRKFGTYSSRLPTAVASTPR